MMATRHHQRLPGPVPARMSGCGADVLAAVKVWAITELPDADCVEYGLAANGAGVPAAVESAMAHFLRVLAGQPPGSVWVEFRLVYHPASDPAARQSRLVIYLIVGAWEVSAVEALRALLTNGPLSAFYTFQETDPAAVPEPAFRVAFNVVRPLDVLKPLYGPEDDGRLPPGYLTVGSFVPNPQNDYLTLDRVLGDLSEGIVVSIAVEPVDVAPVQAAHTRYIEQLEFARRRWLGEENDDAWPDPGGARPTFAGRAAAFSSSHSDPQLGDALRRVSRFQETLLQPHLRFHIRVLAAHRTAARMVASVVAESAFREGSYRFIDSDLPEPGSAEPPGHVALTGVQACIPSLPPWANITLFRTLTQLASVAPVEELVGACHLPAAGPGSPSCIRKNTDPPIATPDLIVFGHDRLPGASRSSGGGIGAPLGISLQRLTEHAFICGLPGHGKTTVVHSLQAQLLQRGVPSMVVEPAKRDYREIKTWSSHRDPAFRNLAPQVEVYTVGKEEVSPLRFNPLEVPRGVSVDVHIANLLECFQAAMPLFGPLPALLGEALELVYAGRPADNPPLMTDLLAAVERVLAAKHYSGEVESDVRAAIDLRLGMLTRGVVGKVFQCRHSTPSIDHLMSVPVVLELDGLPPDVASLITLFYIRSIRAYRRAHPAHNSDLCHVTIIEEAHRLVGPESHASTSGESADVRRHASRAVVDMLTEVRGEGEGVVLADQHPSEVASHVVKSVGSIIAFRQVALDDRKELGAAMLFGRQEFEEIARLRRGEAFLFTQGYYRSHRIRTIHVQDGRGFRPRLDDAGLRNLVQDQPWWQNTARARLGTELTQLGEELARWESQVASGRRGLRALLDRHPRVLRAKVSRRPRRKLLRLLADRARVLRRQLLAGRDAFVRGPYQRFIGDADDLACLDPGLAQRQAELVHRFEHESDPLCQRCLVVLDRLIQRCRAPASD